MFYGSPIEQLFESTKGVKTMSAIAINPQIVRPAIRRSRKANLRLTRSLVALSLAVVLGAGFALQAGAGSKVQPTKPDSFVTVTIAPGETVWSIAKALNSSGDLRQLVDQIITVNSLQSADLTAGSKIRVPLK